MTASVLMSRLGIDLADRQVVCSRAKSLDCPRASMAFLETPEVKPPLTIDVEMTVDEIMRRWPTTIRVFILYRMMCIGCPIGVFHTVRDACEAHHLDEDSFTEDILTAMKADAEANIGSAFEKARLSS